MDPITAFAACKAAYSGIQGAIGIYQDLKKTGHDLSGITHEVGGMLSSFFQGQQHLEDEHEKQKEQAKKDMAAGKPRNVTMEAIDNVMRLREIRRYYAELEHMVRYELGMPDLWREIVDERQRLINEREAAKRAKELAEQQAEAKRQYRLARIRQNISLVLAIILGVVTIVGTVCAIELLIQEDMTRRYEIYG